MSHSRNEPATRRVLAVLRWPVGGIRTHIAYDYPALLEAGYRFTFVGPADRAFRAFAGQFATWDGVEFVEAPLRGEHCRLLSTAWPLLRSGRFDLIHSHGVTAGAQMALANIRRGVPHVMTMHDVFRPGHADGILGRSKLWVADRLLGGCDAVVALGEDVRQNLVEYLPRLRASGCRLERIPLGIDTDRFCQPVPDEENWLKDKLGLDESAFLMGFLGRFMEQKGFLPLLEALALLAGRATARRFHLVAVGSGDCERRYRARMESLGLGEHVTFLQFVPDVAPTLRQLDLVVMPSLWEAAPLLAMEALCAGVPLLGTSCIGLRELLHGSPSVVVPPDDAAALADALAEAIRRPWPDAARAYAATARERFSARRSSRQLRQLFDELLAGAGRTKATAAREQVGAGEVVR
jgi:glycosyltransferase involved in cell wall biosynthesis